MALINTYTLVNSLVSADQMVVLTNSGTTLALINSSNVTSTAAINTGKMLYVDAVNGSDSTGARGKLNLPYLTLLAAQTAASSGDTIHVFPGSYALSAALAGKDGVNWYFEAGAIVTSTNGFCFDVTTGITFAVQGFGDFVGASAGGGLKVNHASADVTFQCKRLRVVGNGGSLAALYVVNAARVNVAADDISGDSTAYYVLYWESGETHVNARRIFNEGGTLSASVIYCASTAAGNKMWITADEIYHSNSSAFGTITLASSMDSTAAVWINAKELRCNASALYANVDIQGGKFYLDAQKIHNPHSGGVGINVSASANLVYINASKVEASVAFKGAAGTSWINIGEHNDSGQTGNGITCSAGTHYVTLKSMVRTVASEGVHFTGGTLRLNGAYIVPLDSAATNNYPVNTSAAGFKATACTFITPTNTSYSIFAPSNTAVQLVGCAANKTTNGVTVQGAALTVDATLT